MKKVCFIFLLFLLSCHSGSNSGIAESIPVKEPTKLEQLLTLSVDSVIIAYDLSNDSIVEFPDLSAYTIRDLDLSDNFLDTVIPAFLPKKLEKLNLSHNQYSGWLKIEEHTFSSLKELDMSYNQLIRILILDPLYRIIVSHNDLVEVDINHKNIQYLDISYNVNMSENVTFFPLWIDTIIREGVANGKPLINPNAPGFIMYCE